MEIRAKIRGVSLSLNPSEKGYVKKFAKTTLSENKSARLEELLDTENTDNTVAGQDDWIYDFLMNCLEEYHKTELSEIRGMLNQIDILLVDKDLPDQAEKLIQRAKKAAIKIKATDILMEITELESSLLAIKPPEEGLTERLEKTFEDLQELSDEHDSLIFQKIKEAEQHEAQPGAFSSN